VISLKGGKMVLDRRGETLWSADMGVGADMLALLLLSQMSASARSRHYPPASCGHMEPRLCGRRQVACIAGLPA
jgi:hypothetical protein